MAHYLDLFSPETYEAFSRSSQSVSGFRRRQLKAAERIVPGDRLVCYMTKLSRWVGVLEVTSNAYVDETPIFYPEEDPFVVRFDVQPVVWLPKEQAVPIHEQQVWERLSFTKTCDRNSASWTGKIRSSLSLIDCDDACFLEELLLDQSANPRLFEVDEKQFQKLVKQRIRRTNGSVAVTVPADEEPEPDPDPYFGIRESHRVQAMLARIGEAMGFRIWLPRNDRAAVLSDWCPSDNALLESLPLNYDEVTLGTIEQIDVLWLKRRSIVRAFEVEHTTAVYSGILRMADLLALQPNMDIKLHLVAPEARREKVFSEIQRPVFSLLERAPLSTCCSFISYDRLHELAAERNLQYLSDAVLENYAEEVE